MRRTRWAWVALLLALGACSASSEAVDGSVAGDAAIGTDGRPQGGDGSAGTGPDSAAGTDSGAGAGTDSGTAAGPDSGTAAGSDSGTGPGTDSGTGTGPDAGPGTDSGTGVGTDSGTGAARDGGSDAGPLVIDQKVAIIANAPSTTDVRFSTGSRFAPPASWGTPSAVGATTTFLRDMDGDRLDDLVVWGPDLVRVRYGTGTQFGPLTSIATGAFAGFVGTTNANTAADLDRDNDADLIAWFTDRVVIRRVDMGQAVPIAMQQTLFMGEMFYGTERNEAYDLNADGYADLIAWNRMDVRVKLGSAAGFGATQTFASATMFAPARGGGIADVDGDMDLDLVAWNDGTIDVRRWNAGTLGAPETWSTGNTFGSQTNLVYDVTGDGRADAIRWSTTSIAVLVSTGTSFQREVSWQGMYVGAFAGASRANNLVGRLRL